MVLSNWSLIQGLVIELNDPPNYRAVRTTRAEATNLGFTAKLFGFEDFKPESRAVMGKGQHGKATFGHVFHVRKTKIVFHSKVETHQ